MTNRKFIEALTAIPNFKGDKERQVEHAYNDMLMDAFPGISISNPFKCRELRWRSPSISAARYLMRAGTRYVPY